MAATRRAIIGGAGVVVLAALGYRAWDRGVFESSDGGAFRPWDEWQGRDSEGIVRTLHAAILAANPHDTQPWLFRPQGDTITMYADRARNLGSFDPFRREMHLGLGCAITNLEFAAFAEGFFCKTEIANGRLALSPSNAPIEVARMKLWRKNAPDSDVVIPGRPSIYELAKVIPHRHTNRGPYHPDRVIAPDLVKLFTSMVDDRDVRLVLIGDSIARGEFTSMEVEATRGIIADPQMSADSAHWFRTSKNEIAAHRDGVTMDTAGLPPLIVMGAKMLPDQDAATADKYWLDMTRDTHAGTAALFGMILVRDRLDMASAIAAGRAWQRLHLAATMHGVAAHPMNQPVEMVDRNAMLGRADSFAHALQHFAHMPGWEPTFTFRMGYAEREARPSPRRPLRDVVVANA